MEDTHLRLILDRFSAQDTLIKTVETGIHRRLDDFEDKLSGNTTRLEVLEKAPVKTASWKNITIGGALLGVLEAGRAAYSWFHK
jgi:hypothetical protein